MSITDHLRYCPSCAGLLRYDVPQDSPMLRITPPFPQELGRVICASCQAIVAVTGDGLRFVKFGVARASA